MRENAVRIANIVPPPGGSPFNVIIEAFDNVSVLGVLQVRDLALCDVFLVHGLRRLSHRAHAIKIDSRENSRESCPVLASAVSCPGGPCGSSRSRACRPYLALPEAQRERLSGQLWGRVPQGLVRRELQTFRGWLMGLWWLWW